MTPLHDDLSRCHDVQCEVREQCRRWTERDTGSQRTVHAFTLRPMYECFDELCRNAILIGDGNQ